MSDTYPADWTRTQVQNVITNYFCGHSPTCEERPIANKEEWGILKTTAITWDGWDENAHKVPPKKYWGKEKIEVKEGDILVTKAGPRHRVGVVAHVQSTRPHLMVSGKMIGIRPQQEMVLPRILAAALSTREPQVFLDHRSTGMAESQVNFNNDVLLTSPIVLPTMPEQRAIAAIMDAVGEAIRQTEALIAKLRLVKAGMRHDLLTRGLDENGELRDSIRHPEQFKDSQLGRIPKAWEINSLGSLIQEIEAGVSVNAWNKPAGGGESGVLKTSCVFSGAFLPEENKTVLPRDKNRVSCPVRANSIIISRMNTPLLVGEIGYVETDYPDLYLPDRLWQTVMRKEKGCSVKWLSYVLNWEPVRKLIRDIATGTSGSMKNISKGVFLSIEIRIPLPEEQEAIANRLSAFDSVLIEESKKNTKLHQLKQGLMQDLLTGHVRVPETMIQQYQAESEVQ